MRAPPRSRQNHLVRDVALAAGTPDRVLAARGPRIGIVGRRKIEHIAPMRKTAVAERANIRVLRMRRAERLAIFKELRVGSIRTRARVPRRKFRYDNDPAIAGLGLNVSRHNPDLGFIRHLSTLR